LLIFFFTHLLSSPQEEARQRVDADAEEQVLIRDSGIRDTFFRFSTLSSTQDETLAHPQLEAGELYQEI